MANLQQRDDPIRPASPGRGQTALPAWIRWGMAVWLGWAGSVFGAPGVTAQLDRETVPLGESVTLSLVFEDVSPTEFPALPAIPSLTVTPQGTSRQHRFVNGQSSSSQTFTYNAAPSRVGDVMIPALQLQAGGRVFTTRPLRLRVEIGRAHV